MATFFCLFRLRSLHHAFTVRRRVYSCSIEEVPTIEWSLGVNLAYLKSTELFLCYIQLPSTRSLYPTPCLLASIRFVSPQSFWQFSSFQRFTISDHAPDVRSLQPILMRFIPYSRAQPPLPHARLRSYYMCEGHAKSQS